MTGDLNSMIENMRECLACTRQGCNNDTDLTFGDANKFYLMNQAAESHKGNLSDEVIFVAPTIRQNGEAEISFVLDKLYGSRTPDMLISHLASVCKKYSALKAQFPQSKISIFVSGTALSSSGCSPEKLAAAIKEMHSNLKSGEEQVTVNVPESAFADHYIEFGGGGRTAGKREVQGVAIWS
jgi:hypothetical protein